MSNLLTTLPNVKLFCKVDSANDDALLEALIVQCSRTILSYLNRDTIALQTFSDAYDGVNNTRLFLNQWPVVSVVSVNINGSAILPAPAQPQQGSGYRLDYSNIIPQGRPQALDVCGNRFWKGQQNVYVVYTAGYSLTDSPQTIPSSAPYTITSDQTYGSWIQDDGVESVAGVVFTATTSTPAAGQYSVNSLTGVYTFNSADASTPMLISYSYVPADIEQACIETVRERYSYKQRVGQKAKSLMGTETAKYDLSALSLYVQMLLQSYQRTSIV